jgi:hypothetical protein
VQSIKENPMDNHGHSKLRVGIGLDVQPLRANFFAIVNNNDGGLFKVVYV